MMYNNEIIKIDLMNMAEEKYKAFSSALIPGCTNMMGVRIPLMRKYAKKLAKGDYDTYLRNALDDSFEELLLQGLVIGYLDIEFEKILAYCDIFIPKINNWSVNDSFCSGMKCFLINQEKGFDYLQKYLFSKSIFECRAAVVLMMDYYINEEYIEKVFSLLKLVKNDAYYVKMAIAWSFTTAYTKYPDKTIRFLTCNDLDDLTKKIIIKKVNESNCIANKYKEIIKKI